MDKVKKSDLLTSKANLNMTSVLRDMKRKNDVNVAIIALSGYVDELVEKTTFSKERKDDISVSTLHLCSVLIDTLQAYRESKKLSEEVISRTLEGLINSEEVVSCALNGLINLVKTFEKIPEMNSLELLKKLDEMAEIVIQYVNAISEAWLYMKFVQSTREIYAKARLEGNFKINCGDCKYGKELKDSCHLPDRKLHGCIKGELLDEYIIELDK